MIAPLYGSMLGLVIAAQLGTPVFATYLCVALALVFASEWRRG